MDKKTLLNRARALAWQRKHPVKYRRRQERWRKANKEKQKLYLNKWKKANKNKIAIYHKTYRRNHPELARLRANYDGMRSRCNNPRNPFYKWYGAKDIKCLLSFTEYKTLVTSKKARKLKKPSIDRLDKNGPYSIKNCEVTEKAENSRRRYKDRGGIHPTFWEKVKSGQIRITQKGKPTSILTKERLFPISSKQGLGWTKW